jgi:hypothetical protein
MSGLTPTSQAGLHPLVVEFLKYLAAHPKLRTAIRAPYGKTILYAGDVPHRLGIAWNEAARKSSAPAFKNGKPFPEVRRIQQELVERKGTDPQYGDKLTLEDVLKRVEAPDAPYPWLHDYAVFVDTHVPDERSRTVVWKALSGIFASNAAGPVSFALGNDISPATKIFASTEIAVLLRNPNVDQTTKDLLAYYQRCLQRGETELVVSIVRA